MPVAVVMAAVLINGHTGCLLVVSTPPLQSQNVQSREKAPASHGARGETPTRVLCRERIVRARRESGVKLVGYKVAE